MAVWLWGIYFFQNNFSDDDFHTCDLFFSYARFAELEHFTSRPDKPIQAGNCDVVIQRPTIFMKLDAGKY